MGNAIIRFEYWSFKKITLDEMWLLAGYSVVRI